MASKNIEIKSLPHFYRTEDYADTASKKRTAEEYFNAIASGNGLDVDELQEMLDLVVDIGIDVGRY